MTETVRETLEVDVLFVGAGPANLAGAYRLGRLVAEHNQRGESPKLEPMIAMIEKSAEVGQHVLSGAVLDPRALDELIPDFRAGDGPFHQLVTGDTVLLLTRRGKLKLPIVPPPLQNHGKYVVSLGDVVRWLAPQVSDMGVQIFPGFPGVAMLYDGTRVVGVRTGDKGIDSKGQRKGNFEPGIDLRAKVTVVGEGARGSLCKELFARLGLHSSVQPQLYAIGVKELWEVPAGRIRAGSVVHTLGYPLKSEEFGGAFLYAMSETQLSLGLVIGLDYKDPFLDPQERLQQLKGHPFFKTILAGGKLLHYGAATLPEGGYYSLPKLWADGVLVVGDSAAFLNGMRLKGIHLGMKSGMLAAETIYEALCKRDFSAATLAGYERRFQQSWAKQELWKARNFHQAFAGGLYAGLVHAGLQLLTGGRGLRDPWRVPAGHEHMRTVQEYYGRPYARAAGGAGAAPDKLKCDGTLAFDKLTDVYHSDTSHEENQPCHLVVRDLDLCHDRCTREYGNPCQHFCPASVYEWLPQEGGGQTFQINFSNCVHCKTCDIMDPYQIIDWTTPEGGGGPRYVHM
jgi:electron-transferring-flavoprotein dehydrogenase